MAFQHLADGNLMSDYVGGSTILQRKLSAMNSQNLGLLNHLECFVIPHVAPETRPSFWLNNSLEGVHCFVFDYSHGLGGECFCKCLISFGTRRLKYQIKFVWLIDWIFRYSILMGNLFWQNHL
jgi:hypothetical protein